MALQIVITRKIALYDASKIDKYHRKMVERSGGNLKNRSLADWEQAIQHRRCIVALFGTDIVGAAYVEQVQDGAGKFQAELRALSVTEAHRQHFREYDSSIALLLIAEAEVVAAALKAPKIWACTPYVSLFWRSGWTVERSNATQYSLPELEVLAVPASVQRTSNKEKVWLYKPLVSMPYAY